MINANYYKIQNIFNEKHHYKLTKMEKNVQLADQLHYIG